MTKYAESARIFLLSSLKDGLAHSYDTKNKSWVKPYPEVTGYILSLFSEIEHEIDPKIVKCADRLVSIQHLNGGFPSFFDKHKLFTFDTSQIMHGLLAVYQKTQKLKYLVAAQKAGEFLLDMQIANGAMFPIYDININAKIVHKNDKKGSEWGSDFSYIQLKNIEGLLLLNKINKNRKYLNAINKLTVWTKNNFDPRYTHPFAYFLEGLVASGDKNTTKKLVIDKVLKRLNSNGYISYYPDSKYAYVSGSIQLGIILHLVGFKKEAKSILCWARKVQSFHKSGGLFQYANPDGSPNNTIHLEINAWGTKYFIQLENLF